jgi:hypothetical protein
LYAVPARAALSIAIVPQIVEKQVAAGARIADVISLRNGGTEAVNVSVELADFTVESDGKVVEHPPGTHATTLSPYLKISPTRVTVAAGEQIFFRYSIAVPHAFTHLREMMFFVARPVSKPPGRAVAVFVPRLGVPIYVENRAASAAALVVDDMHLERSGDSLQLEVLLRNTGQRIVRPGGTIEILDGKRVVASVEFNQGSAPVLPDNSRRFVTKLPAHGGAESTVSVRVTAGLRTVVRRDLAIGAAVPRSSSSSF